MKFQYVSDLHLEMSKTLPNIQRQAPNLILAGDIGIPTQDIYVEFLKYVSHQFETVFIITGNHEYYQKHEKGLDMNQIDELIREICGRLGNVHFFQNEIFLFGSDICIFGSTLWSRITKEEYKTVECFISDYRMIPKLNVDNTCKLHEESVQHLQFALSLYPNRRFVVICHHIPKLSLVLPKYQGSSLNSAFASDVDCMDTDQIIAVVYGHTHVGSIQGKFYCNPIGYPGENETKNYDNTFEI